MELSLPNWFKNTYWLFHMGTKIYTPLFPLHIYYVDSFIFPVLRIVHMVKWAVLSEILCVRNSHVIGENPGECQRNSTWFLLTLLYFISSPFSFFTLNWKLLRVFIIFMIKYCGQRFLLEFSYFLITNKPTQIKFWY